mmetsp:Transcript_9689/g.15944  ORF Transcript_9689/g.15944 Transcript_9689/m.15944 type:complete len:205 (+) Transcript_9689:635-1249(+)
MTVRDSEAIPKSIILTCNTPTPSSVSSTFSQDRSLCAIPILCKKHTPVNICDKIGRMTASRCTPGMLLSVSHHAKRSPLFAKDDMMYTCSGPRNRPRRLHAYGKRTLFRCFTMAISIQGRSLASGNSLLNSSGLDLSRFHGILLTATDWAGCSWLVISSTIPFPAAASAKVLTHVHLLGSHMDIMLPSLITSSRSLCIMLGGTV